jgi:outer membrane protein OmpA-like peptidoglycan-associated protein
MTSRHFPARFLTAMLATGLSAATIATARAAQTQLQRSVAASTAVPPSPPQPTDYVIYFGFDADVISTDAQEILGKAARDVASIVSLDSDYRTQMLAYYAEMTAPGQPPQPLSPQENAYYQPSVVIVANTDTSGSANYNLRLSERRAKAAADALVTLGVAPDSISTRGKGETDPAVPTGDNAPEPLNRRVTIHVSAAGH